MAKVEHLRYWVQKVLPLVYDDSLSYYELLDKVVVKLNETIDVANVTEEHITEEVERVIGEMYENGDLAEIIGTTLDDIEGRMSQVEEDFGTLSTDIDSRVDAVEDDMETLQGSVSDLSTAVDGLGDDISRIDGDIDAVEDDISSLETGLDNVSKSQFIVAGKNIAFFGDSWTVGSGATNPATQRFSTLIATKFGMVEKNFGVGASGFTRPLTFMSQLENANSNLSANDKSNTTLVVMCGGVNDIRNQGDTTMADFIAAVIAWEQRAIEVFPNALICMAVGNTVNTPVNDTGKHWVMSAIMAMKDTHSTGKTLIIDHVGASINGRANTYASDDLHPNTYGHSLLAGFLENAIRGGSTDTMYYYGSINFNESLVNPTSDPHIFRQTENVLITNGILQLQDAITTNTVVGTYSGPFSNNNLYVPLYRSNVIVGSLAITTSGSVRIIPSSGVSMSSGWELRMMDVVFMFKTLIT